MTSDLVSMTAQHPYQGELSHQSIKKFYRSTNKNDLAGQLVKQERQYTQVRRQHDIFTDSNNHDKGGTGLPAPENSAALLPPHLHHQLSDSPSNVFNLMEFLQSSPDDPAFHVRTILF